MIESPKKNQEEAMNAPVSPGQSLLGRRAFLQAPDIYRTPGRDHWGPVQTAFFAGGGVQGGAVIGASDASGAYPAADPQTPENFAATIYDALGIPRSAEWHDTLGRPYAVYMDEPIRGLRR
jgi:carbohydrate-binding DOMON domain-containing protein